MMGDATAGGFRRAVTALRPVALRSVALVGLLTLVMLLELDAVLPVLAVIAVARALPATLAIGERVTFALPLVMFGILAATAVLQPMGHGLEPLPTWVPMIALGTLRPWNVSLRSRSSQGFLSMVPFVMAVFAAVFMATSALLPAKPTLKGGVELRVTLMAGHEDGSSHFMLYSSALQSGGFPLTRDARATTVNWGYPSAFHVTAASLHQVLAQTRGIPKHPSSDIDSFWVAALLVFGAFSGAVAAAAWQIARKLDPAAHEVWAAGAAVASGLTAIFPPPVN